MKLSILTATYNRASLLKRLYESMTNNLFEKLEIEWLIMDDGSIDETEEVVQKFETNESINIKYFKQANQGKMTAINNLTEHVTGELMVECDSDDYFTPQAFEEIYNAYSEYKNMDDIYALVFLKHDQNNQSIGKTLKNNEITTMFNLHFKDMDEGEKALVYISKIRKRYKYELEDGEKFVTEASLFYRIDEKYNIVCINLPIMICEYQKNGYTYNSLKVFKEYPKGFFKFFEYVLSKNLKGKRLKKRLYVVKHYILFSYLANSKISFSKINDPVDKFLVLILYVPGILASKRRFKK